jgi:hypothetical protein
MKLIREQCQRLLRDRGIWTTEACDKCGQLLGSIRWTQRGEPGEWCSAACRDGVSRSVPTPNSTAMVPLASVRRERIGARPAGRPRKHANNAEKCRHYRQSRKARLVTRNTRLEQIEDAQLAAARNGSCVAYLIPATQALETAPQIEFLLATPTRQERYK